VQRKSGLHVGVEAADRSVAGRLAAALVNVLLEPTNK
jgi:hypothetical protein